MNDVMTKFRHLAPATQPISPAKYAHFVLRTGQFDKMAEWYKTVLAARIVFRDERLCFLSYDDEHHRLALIHMPGLAPRDPESAGTDHVAYSYRDLGELLANYRQQFAECVRDVVGAGALGAAQGRHVDAARDGGARRHRTESRAARSANTMRAASARLIPLGHLVELAAQNEMGIFGGADLCR